MTLVAGIQKMYNSIHVGEVEQHCHRFLWHNLEDRGPDIYVIIWEGGNVGDRLAAAISVEAVYKMADMVKKKYLKVTELLKQSIHVGDICSSFSLYKRLSYSVD